VLKTRLLLAAAILTPLLLIIWADQRANLGLPGIWLLPVGLLITGLAAAELRMLFRPDTARPATWLCVLAAGLVAASAGVPILWRLVSASPYPPDCPLGSSGWILLALLTALGAAVAVELWRYQQPSGLAAARIGFTLLAAVYLGLPMAFLFLLRMLGDGGWGLTALVSTIVVVKVSDSGAYFSGRAWGRHKLAPLVSPKKTVEGAVGGLLAAVLAAWFCRGLLAAWMGTPQAAGGSLLAWALFGLALGMAGMFGDLAESLLKRDAACKDSSHWLPGLGGVLDILDSLLATAPVSFVFWAAGLIGPAG
jgi:phosphatidate cytidylyltransferase